MATGKLKMYDRGYSFLTDDGGGPDIFVHVWTYSAQALSAPPSTSAIVSVTK
jgi:cold shock CspA family protein